MRCIASAVRLSVSDKIGSEQCALRVCWVKQDANTLGIRKALLSKGSVFATDRGFDCDRYPVVVGNYSYFEDSLIVDGELGVADIADLSECERSLAQ